jgi:hypothetical protein
LKEWLELLRPAKLAEGVDDVASVQRFQAAATGKSKTLVFVRTTSDSIFGGFLMPAWTGFNGN